MSVTAIPQRKDERRKVAAPGDPWPNAHTFLQERHTDDGGILLLRHHQGEWRRWDGTCWPLLDDKVLRKQLYLFFAPTVYWKATSKGSELVEFNPTSHKVNDLLHAMEAICHVERDIRLPAWIGPTTTPDQAEDLIPVRNGLLSMRTRKLWPATPAFFNYSTLPFDHDPTADCLRWKGFLRTIWPDDPDAIACLQEMHGYILSGHTNLQKLFGIIGPPRSGKGTIARILTALLGTGDVAGPSLASLATNFGLQSLIGKRLAIMGDARLRGVFDDVAARLLSISGEDVLDVDRKNREAWTGRLPTRILILSNETPSLAEASGALSGRFVLLRLLKSWYGEEDSDLEPALLQELPGILNWALDGRDRLQQRGRFVMPASSADLVAEMAELSSPISAFVRDCCLIGDGLQARTELLYEAWRDWCKDQGRDRPGTIQSFGRDLRAVVPGVTTSRPRSDMGGRHRYYEGVALGSASDPPAPPSPEEPPPPPELPL